MTAVTVHDIFGVFIAEEVNAVDDRHHRGKQARAYPTGKVHAVIIELIADFIVKVAGIDCFIALEDD
jgi:hypothetical protein